MIKWLHQMPTKDFNCMVTYETVGGRRKSAHCKTRAAAADIALDIAERQLRADKRRRVARVVYGKAIEQ